MPEIAEVYRIVHFIQQSLVGKTVAVAKAQDDTSVFGKVGTSAAEFEKALSGKKIVGAGSQGKYFWIEMASPPHPVLHFGMTGWFFLKDQHTYYYRPKPDEAPAPWPPKFWKFQLQMKPVGKQPAVEAAFADARRFGRVRLVHCAGKDLRKTTPLKENGPDPFQDREIFTRDWFAEKCKSKKIPIKALLLDQANISGIGNWVGDEVLYQARIHPEQYSNTLSEKQLTDLHKSIVHVCKTACEALGDTEAFPDEAFPDDWLFKHRWGKGKKESTNRLPTDEKIVFVTVGGRTSAVVPSVQKKTGAVAKDVEEDEESESGVQKKPKGKKRKLDEDKKNNANGAIKEEGAQEEDEKPAKKSKKGAVAKVKDAVVNGTKRAKAEVKAASKAKSKSDSKSTKGSAAKSQEKTGPAATAGRRRSARVSAS